jgi:hypothetical protein
MRTTEGVYSSSEGQSGPGYGTGDQLYAPWGTVNQSKGDGNHFPGAIFNGPVNIGKN